MSTMRYWLMKSEEDVYSIDDLERDGVTPWTEIRNYEARNLMRDEMAPGDRILFYHSNGRPPGVAGIAEVAGHPYPDPTQFDQDSRYFDPGSSSDEPKWWLVDVAFVEKLPRTVPLPEIKEHPALQEMVLVKRPRLSVQPVTGEAFSTIRKLARQNAEAE